MQPAELPPPPAPPAAQAAPEPEPASRAAFTVAGAVSGGGVLGPGGTVVWLKRTDGPTPRPRPAKGKLIVQKDKTFVPRVLPVPVGTAVGFRNDDAIFHNVFSLSRPNDFDLGLYKAGLSKDQAFEQAGPVQLLCNIHASMIGWVVVVDTPWYGQAGADGRFQIKGVPAGEYVLEAWHESMARKTTLRFKVGGDVANLAVAVDGDKRAPAFVPDKAGKPRQVQLGY